MTIIVLDSKAKGSNSSLTSECSIDSDVVPLSWDPRIIIHRKLLLEHEAKYLVSLGQRHIGV